MDDLNPYAAPEIPAAPSPDVFDALFASRGCWRAGNAVVTTLEGQLPPRCVVTNEPALRLETLSMTWYPSWATLSLFLGPLFFVPLMFLGRKVDVSVCTGATHEQRKKNSVRVGVILLVAAVAMFAWRWALASHEWLGAACIVAAVTLGVTGFIKVANGFAQPLTIKRVDKRFVWLSGAGRPFLESLPPWPGK